MDAYFLFFVNLYRRYFILSHTTIITQTKNQVYLKIKNNKTLKIILIGISDNKPNFTPEIKTILQKTTHFAGGKRHYERVKECLPANAEWTSITVPLTALFDKLRSKAGKWIIFASGDPLFFGIGNTLKRKFPDAEFTFFPAFNSLQLLGQKLGINYGPYKTVSLTGRNWHEFDRALLQGEKHLGILTDRKKTPAVIAARMLAFGYNNYRMFYGECMGGEHEKTTGLSLPKVQDLEIRHPNCFFLEKTNDKFPRKGIPETEFELLDGRPNMITKMPIRLTTLAALELHNKKVFWDIGACTGSISIETRLLFPQVKVVAFEKRKESKAIIEKNAQRFQTPGIQLLIDDYQTINKDNLEQPDAVFLGGYGGKMEKILNDIKHRLPVNGTLVFNSVSEKSKNDFLNWGKKNKYYLHFQQKLSVDEHNPISILALKKSRTEA